MYLTRLDVRNVRVLADVSLRPSPGINVLLGDNGSGKTSLLEAVHLLGYGRSFRGRVRDGLVRSGEPALEVFAEWQETTNGRFRKTGLRHSGQTWEGRVDGEPVAQLGDLCAALAVVSFEPGSHALISGPGEPRRRYVDWGLFHVERAFLPVWRRYARALKQRNSLLKRGLGGAQLDAWDAEFVESGEAVTRQRQQYLHAVEALFSPLSQTLSPDLGAVRIEFRPGWRQDQMPLADALLLSRERDLQFGHTSVGPHRADWGLHYDARPNGEAPSRGQAKVAALCSVIAQAQLHAVATGDWPVVLLDDLASELDRSHQARILEHLRAGSAQILLTGTEIPTALIDQDITVFHVKQGSIVAASRAP